VSIAPCDRLLPMFQLRTFHGQTARNPKVRVADNWGVDAITENTTAIREISFGAGDFRKSDSRALLHV
jgi:hypothetical protein